MNQSTTDPRYPIGKYEPQLYSDRQLRDWLNDIRYLPSALESSLLNLDEAQIDTPYRDGGWTIRQVVHHVADSHMNAIIRFKLGLTEEVPKIKTYQEKRWAELGDSIHLPPNISLTLLHALHARWYEVISRIDRAGWDRTVFHPELQREVTLWHLLGMYAWHGRHHTAHINTARENNGWI